MQLAIWMCVLFPRNEFDGALATANGWFFIVTQRQSVSLFTNPTGWKTNFSTGHSQFIANCRNFVQWPQSLIVQTQTTFLQHQHRRYIDWNKIETTTAQNTPLSYQLALIMRINRHWRRFDRGMHFTFMDIPPNIVGHHFSPMATSMRWPHRPCSCHFVYFRMPFRFGYCQLWTFYWLALLMSQINKCNETAMRSNIS